MALPDDRRIDVSRFPQQIQRFLSDEAPTQARLIVARGTLPMPPVVQACALYQLQVTSDDEVRLAALETMKRMAPAAVRQVAGEALPPVVLDWIAEVFQAQQPIVRTVLLNANTDGDTFVRLARLGDEATTETIALNQARLLSTPGLIQALYLNRNTRASTADRIVDFGVRNQVDLRDLPCYDEIVAAIQVKFQCIIVVVVILMPFVEHTVTVNIKANAIISPQGKAVTPAVKADALCPAHGEVVIWNPAIR